MPLSRNFPIVVASLAWAVCGCGSSRQPSDTSRVGNATTATGPVTVEFLHQGLDDQGFAREVTLEGIAAGSTVESVMRSIQDPPIVLRGRGVTAFVESIGGIKTSATDGWTYRVDGEFADRGIGTTELVPPARISWKFGAWDESEP